MMKRFVPTRGLTALAIMVPNGAESADTMPMMSPSLTITRCRLLFATVAVIELGNIASSEVPRAMRSEAPKISESAGTAIDPPPMPSSPASVPMNTPTRTMAMPVTGVRTIEESLDGVKHICETITKQRKTT